MKRTLNALTVIGLGLGLCLAVPAFAEDPELPLCADDGEVLGGDADQDGLPNELDLDDTDRRTDPGGNMETGTGDGESDCRLPGQE